MRFRRSLFILALALLLHSSPALGGQSQLATSADHEWCDDASSWSRHATACEVREVTLDAGPIDVDAGPNGGISVVGSDGREVRVTARVIAHARDEGDARDLLDGIEIDIDGREIDVRRASRRDAHDEGWSVSFRIEVPRDTDLDLATHNGSISISGVASRIRFSTSNGSLELRDLAGDVEGRTSNGSVAVHLSGDRWDGEGLDVTTSNGSVRLAIPEDYSAHLETGTVNGRVDLDFPVTVQGRLTGNLSLDLGDGGAPIRVKTTNGRVRVGRPE